LSLSYDREKQWTAKATVTEFRYLNPHAQIYFDVTDSKGTVAHWSGELLPNPAQLIATGWTRRRSMDALKAGTPITITVAPARAGGNVVLVMRILNEKGEELLKKFPDAKTPPGLHFNPYFANLNLAMPPPLTTDGQVTYADGKKATVDQMAQDVSAFLVWTAQPDLERRHAAGLAVVLFLLVATILGFLAKQQIWHGGERPLVRETGALDPTNQAKTRRAKGKAGVAG